MIIKKQIPDEDYNKLMNTLKTAKTDKQFQHLKQRNK